MRSVLRLWSLLLVVVAAALAQGDVVAPGDNLVVEGIPPIPVSL